MFRITSSDGKKPHSHLVFVNLDAGVVEVATANDHTHVAEVQTETIDPATLQPIPLPAPVVKFSFDGEDNHSHEMGGEVPVELPKPKKESDEDKVNDLREMFRSARDGERASRRKAKEAEDFYQGRQWDQKHRDHLTSNGRTALTVNHIENSVDTLSGYFRQNRTDFRFWGVEKSDNVVADIVTEVVRNICEQNEFAHVETCVFEDEVVAGRGVFHSYVDYDRNVEGDIKIERYEWDDVYVSDHNKADASDAEHCHKSKWFSKDKLKNEYPDKAENLQADYNFNMLDDADREHVRVPGRQYEWAFDHDYSENLVPDFIDIKRKEFRVVETEQKQYRRVPVLTRIDYDDAENAEYWPGEYVTAAKALGFSVIRRPSCNIRVSKWAGTVLLEDYVVKDKHFSITPVYAKKRKRDWYGKIEAAKDPQRELNKLRSQQIDLVNKMTVDGWFFERDSFSSPAERRKFEQKSATGGFQSELNSMAKKPERESGSQLPSGLINAMETSREEIKQVLNVQPEVLNSKSTSGLALIQGQKMALLGSEYLYDNMAQSKKRLGERLVYLIQMVYTPDRIMRILMANAQRKQLEIGGQRLDPQNEQMMQQLEMRIQQALDNEELTKLDLVVGETSHSPNKQLADFSMGLEIQRVSGGEAMSPNMLIELSPLSEDIKAKAIESNQQRSQAAAQAEQQKQQAEIQKSLPDEMKMIQQGIPPQGGPGQMGR